jgi:three-Cys-motif partner protein
MTPPKNNKDERTLPLFDDLGSIEDVENGIKQIEFRGLQAPVWTSQKAKLIALYLKFFVMVTKHGTYIDGFSGPQEPDMPDSWAANLVLNNEPRWLRNFFLCELDKEKVESLNKLAADHPAPRKGQPKRSIKILSGDFNQSIDLVLQSGIITEKEAAFALLDQRTFECHWETVKKLATHKKQGNKIELFYFLAVKWLHRSFSGLTVDTQKAQKWWGSDDWVDLKKLSQVDITTRMQQRLRNEFGYRYAHAWPIWERDSAEGSVMYYMIHATDHEDGPKLMWRAYRQAVAGIPRGQQLSFDLSDDL